MRTLRVGLLILLVASLVACTARPSSQPTPPVTSPPATAPSPSTALGQPAPTATSAAAPAPEATTTPATPWAEGPLVAEGEFIRGIAIAPGSAVRYGLLGNGLARSDDGGQTWRRVSNAIVHLPLVSPANPDILYAGDFPACLRGDEDPLFYRSTDGGTTWQETPAGRGIRPIAFRPGDPSTIYGISCWAVNVSRDGGVTWEKTGPTQGWDITDILLTEGPDARFLAILTSEGGTSHLAWFNQNGELEQDLTEGLSFWGAGVLASGGSSLYIADATGVRRSDDGGQHWTLFKEGLEDVILSTDPITEGISDAEVARGYGLFALVSDPRDPRRLVLGTVRGVYLSEDRGEHWRPLGIEALARARVNGLDWEPAQPGVLYATTEVGVYRVHLGG